MLTATAGALPSSRLGAAPALCQSSASRTPKTATPAIPLWSGARPKLAMTLETPRLMNSLTE